MYPYYESDWSILPPENNRRFSPGLSITTIKQAINETIESGLLRKQTPIRLRELIRQIRTSKTASEERGVVNTECANIRATFRETNALWKCRNIAKLLYIHMLGYPAHFGQLECLKLASSPKYTDKRIGYLGAMLLLDERQDVHLLMTNCLKNDLNNSSQFIVGLALCSLGAIASPEMAKDLAGDVERLMGTTNLFLRKKAILCAFRIIRKVPDLIEVFIPSTNLFLSDKNHSILISAITLITEMCELNVNTLIYFKSIIPNLVRIMKSLLVSGYSPDHVVNGMSDPFLQVKILRLLGILGHNDTRQSEMINDLLAQVATNTETNKNCGNAVLYQTVLTIMNIESEVSLRVLAVNILGRFLLNSDKNIRYIALITLVKTINSDITAIQRHRTIILECLKDPDTSIQKCAMELAFGLINSLNVRKIIADIMEFLEKADIEFKAICSSRIVTAAEKFSPSIHWHLDTLLSVLLIAGNNVRDDVTSSTIQLISNSPPDEQRYITSKMWETLLSFNNFEDKQPLVQVAVWAIGEYADQTSFDETELIDFYRTLLWTPQLSTTTKQYVLLSLAKISVRMDEGKDNIQIIMNIFSSHINVDLQQRAVEFSQLFSKYEHLRTSLLEKMPIIEFNRISEAEHNLDFAQSDDASEVEATAPVERDAANQNILLDLLTDSEEPTDATNPQIDFMSLFGQTTEPKVEYNASTITIIDQDDLEVVLILKKEKNLAVLTARTTNKSFSIFENYIFQAAVPKSFLLNILPPSSTVLLPGETTVQDIQISRQNAGVMRMKIRITYEIDGSSVLELADVNEFPDDLFD